MRAAAHDRRLPILLAGFVVFLSVAAWNAYRLATPPTRLPADEQAADLREEAAVLIREIEAYRTAMGRLPEAQLIGDRLGGGFVYRVLDPVAGLYEVTRSAGDVSVTYDGSMTLGLWVLVGGAAERASPDPSPPGGGAPEDSP